MKTIAIILIFLGFFQASVLPLNLGLILLLTRAFIRQDNANLILAFVFGLLLSILLHLSLGLLSLLFILLVEITYLWSKTTFARNILTIVPVVFGGVLIVRIITNIHQIWPQLLLEVIIILPIFLVVRFWEERFIAPKEIKLKV